MFGCYLKHNNDNNEQPRVFHNLHSKIGRYLLEHSKELHIEKRREAKEMDIILDTRPRHSRGEKSVKSQKS